LISRDTGQGIDEKIKEKIFEPYFQQKKMGRTLVWVFNLVTRLSENMAVLLSWTVKKAKAPI
jgi:C4-dicarboxylate-specific signal transduction histidine kinase